MKQSALGLMLCLLLSACGGGERWPYAQTPIPPPETRGGKPFVLLLGDSTAAGWQVCAPIACTGIVYDWWAAALGDTAWAYSRGVGNSTSADLLQRWERDISGQPDLILILIGINDLTRGLSAEDVLANFAALYRRAEEAGFVLVFSTILPSDTYDDNARAQHAALNAALRAQNAWPILDLAALMGDPRDPSRLRREDIAHDGSAHPNQRGYERMGAAVRAWWAQEGAALLADKEAKR